MNVVKYIIKFISAKIRFFPYFAAARARSSDFARQRAQVHHRPRICNVCFISFGMLKGVRKKISRIKLRLTHFSSSRAGPDGRADQDGVRRGWVSGGQKYRICPSGETFHTVTFKGTRNMSDTLQNPLEIPPVTLHLANVQPPDTGSPAAR